MAKARNQKLNFFRTPIGFHDAYVAAASQKAALEAWGSDGNLFAQGIAAEVTDAALMKKPLARPGTVVRVSRGTAEEHFAAVGRVRRKGPSTASRSSGRVEPSGGRYASGRSPRNRGEEKKRKPSRADLDRAEAALAAVEKRHRAELREIESAQAALDSKRRSVRRRQEAELARAEASRVKAKRAYEQTLGST